MVKPGYKQTEVGVIPEDWEILQFSDVGQKFLNGGTPSTQRLEFWNGTIPWITGADIVNQKIINVRRFITEDAIKYSSTNLVEKSNLLIATRTGVGKLAIAPFDVAISQDITGVYINIERVLTEYLFRYFDFHAKDLRNLNQGTSIEGITRETLISTSILIPPLAEQRAIAEALSDVDALIAALDKLIAKKRAVKTAAMQQLLTGKIRLPGFGGEWIERKLGDVMSYERPDKYIVKNTKYSDFNDIPVLTANKSFILGYTNESLDIFENLPIILFDDFTTDSKFVDFPFKVKSSAIKILTQKVDEINLRYIFEKMQLIQFPIGDHKRYYISEYQYIKLFMPQFEEQNAIAQILSNMEGEIAVLETGREKTHAIKQGMLQELLTGKMRLLD